MRQSGYQGSRYGLDGGGVRNEAYLKQLDWESSKDRCRLAVFQIAAVVNVQSHHHPASKRSGAKWRARGGGQNMGVNTCGVLQLIFILMTYVWL